jgi:hypothetical protein
MNRSVKVRFRVSDLLFLTAIVAIGAGWYVDHLRLKRLLAEAQSAPKAIHKYEVAVEGTPGVELAMTLIKRPFGKHTQTIRVPFSMRFDAVGADVYIEDLPDGKSGNHGDTYTLSVKKDGVRIPRTMSGLILKDNTGRQYNGHHQLAIGD